MPPTARRASAKGATPPAPASTSSEPPSPSPSASSSRAREEALSTLLAFAVVALGSALLLGLRRLGFASDDMLPPPSPSKPYADFETFYAQRYLPEHSRGGTRALHAAGTLAALALLAAEPALASAMGFAVLCGLAAFEYLRFLSHGLIEFAIVLGAYVAAGAALTGSWRRAAVLPLVSYALAWAGHFFVEHNRPATFIYPTFSLLGDFRMVFEMARGLLGGPGLPAAA